MTGKGERGVVGVAAWWAARPRLAWLSVAVFVLLNVLTHDGVQRIAAWLGEVLTIERLSRYVTLAGAGAILAAAGAAATRLRSHPGRNLLLFYGAATAILLALSYNALFMVNTEAIHFPQYALLGMLVLPLVGRFAEAILWVTFFGALDEAWQYWVLSNSVEFVYFDFNDVVLNLIGGAFGVLLLAVLLGPVTSREPTGYGWRRFWTSPPALVTAVLILLGVGLWLVGLLVVYPSPGAWVVLARAGRRAAFWATSYWGKTAHVLTPLEGLTLVVALVAFYVPLDARLRVRLRDAPAAKRP